ncbi:hypothetical protein BCR36DRAFT_579920 [Piromyces finnis]|uniref:Uncharacterized protein n=1 Tax=Piromyces finnis TaxID=1754191 RepID=A0A1Y1VLK0_9FUNG|nr:hypothetical protein BCR36DRAFT_579920 [Piromyces finnis]|eukprot:ORX59337.1 hypothetical protein BCR36DRAFT_579920 [Piromyces finnis]
MSLLNNLVQQVKTKEKLNHCRFINNTRCEELDEFFKECQENKQTVYPSWISINQINSKKKKKTSNAIPVIPSNPVTPGTVVVIDDDNDQNYSYIQGSVSTRTRSKTNSLLNNTQFTQIPIDNFLPNLTNIFTNIIPGGNNNNVNKSSRGRRRANNNSNVENLNNENQTSRSRNLARRNFFARGFFRGRGRARARSRK